MASTPIYNWPTPDNTDLVKNGALAIRTLGDAIDTTVDTMIPETIFAAKGDLLGASANDTPAILSVGANGETLVADSSTSTGLRYQGSQAAGKNKIINGAMTIDQRNSAGSAVTINANADIYSVDRWSGIGQAADGVFTLAQDTSAPDGFSNSLKATITTADASIGSTQAYSFRQKIEGFNVADFGFGTANAKTITVSFWVRSSVTGDFGGSIRNSASNRSYAFLYNIAIADTWEKKSVTIAGDTSGTWLKTTGTGLNLAFSLGVGSSFLGTAGSWAGANYIGATGQTQLISTLGATLYITGVQVEAGSVATAFQTATGTIQGELSAAQRYYWRAGLDSSGTFGILGNSGYTDSTTNSNVMFNFPVHMRVAPTAIDFPTLSTTRILNVGNPFTPTAASLNTTNTTADIGWVAFTSSGMTASQFSQYTRNSSSTSYIGFSAEL
jgi:hypothetical protein